MHKIVLLVSFTLVVFFSCKKEKGTHKENTIPRKQIEEKPIFFKTDSLTEMYSIVSEKGVRVRLWSSEYSTQDTFSLFGDKNHILISKEKKSKNKFTTVKIDTLLSNEYTYVNVYKESFIKKKVNDEEYLLFSLKETFKGRAVTGRDISFFMLHLNSLQFYTLTYSGEPTLRCEGCIDGAFEDNKYLNEKPALKKVLYAYASKSKHIYMPSKEEKAISYYKNYVQKWYKDNKVENTFGAGHADIMHVIYSTYYKEDIFKFTGDYGSNFIENDRFKIVNFFRGSLLGYNKQKKLYFPVLVESCNYDCNKEIGFLEGNSIDIQYEWSNGDSFQINLEDIKFLN